MTQHPKLAELLQLEPEERLALVEAIWDSLAESPEAVPIPDWHRQELADRLAADDNDETPGESWGTLRERIEKRS